VNADSLAKAMREAVDALPPIDWDAPKADNVVALPARRA
jgi:hypothetical protein